MYVEKGLSVFVILCVSMEGIHFCLLVEFRKGLVSIYALFTWGKSVKGGL